jgi:hypothetical protein
MTVACVGTQFEYIAEENEIETPQQWIAAIVTQTGVCGLPDMQLG